MIKCLLKSGTVVPDVDTLETERQRGRGKKVRLQHYNAQIIYGVTRQLKGTHTFAFLFG